MAQPVFDGHPLEEYFDDSGEASELMPGGIADVSFQPYLTDHPSISKHAERMEKLCFLVFDAVQSLRSLFSSDSASLRSRAFAERFKYGVISSSLLSPAFAATPMAEPHRRGLGPSLPGKLSNHSRTPSAADSTLSDTLSLSMPPDPDIPIWPSTLSFTVAVGAFSVRFYFVSFLLLAGTVYYIHVHRRDPRSKPDVMTPSLLALQHLVSAGQLWDTVINDAFTTLENEEQSIFYGPRTPLTPSSSLRVALSTSLLTTQTQCDNVRQLLSAITSPTELAQLTEMYAPPSPIKSTFPHSSDARRPLSHPGSPPCDPPLTDRMRKRSTWNGSYVSLALAGTPPAFQLARRREKRRSDLSALMGPATPSPPGKRTQNALLPPPQLVVDSDDEGGMVTAESSLAEDDEENSFGAAALRLYRNRVHGGLRTLELSPRQTPTSRGTQSTRPRTTMSPGSKYTRMRPTRHPFSLSSLRQSLQNALGSKRFACAHLLALRFEDDDDEVYWEDVRAVMSLLTSTLVDAAARLTHVLDDLEEHHRHAADSVPSTPAASPPMPFTADLAPPPPAHGPLSDAVAHMVSFAPTPSHLARFAAHASALSTALDDAREQLAICVAALRDDHTGSSPGHSSRPSSASLSDAGIEGKTPAQTETDAQTPAETGTEAQMPAETGTHTQDARASTSDAEHPAIQAYERLRRELGLALRECERGRARLVHVLMPPTPTTDEDPLPVPVPAPTFAPTPTPTSAPAPCKEGDVEPVMYDAGYDDNTTHPVLSMAVPLGVEQVFEADTGAVGGFARERSRLSREERIARAKAERARPSSPPHLVGPGEDVVQELKDVIWKVGQRRQKLAGVGS